MKTSNSVRFTLRILGILLALPFLSLAVRAQAFVSARTGVDVGTCPITSPCRSITYSLAQIGGGGSGTVNIIDSGNYEPFTVNDPVTVQAAPGVVAVISRNTPGPGITIGAQGSELVTIRGLTLNLPDNLLSPNPTPVSSGFNITGGGIVVIDRCIVRGFTIGINAKMIGEIFVRDTQVSGGTTGINLSANYLLLRVFLERCKVVRSTTGLNVTTSPEAIIRMAVLDSEFSGMVMGVNVVPGANGTATVTMESCAITNNKFGLSGEGAGVTVRVSNSTIVENGAGLTSTAGAALLSRGNNTVEGNEINNNFTGTFLAK